MLGTAHTPPLHCRRGHGYRKWDLELSVKFIIHPEKVWSHISSSAWSYGSEGNGMCSTWKSGGFSNMQLKVRTYPMQLRFKLWLVCEFLTEKPIMSGERHYFQNVYILVSKNWKESVEWDVSFCLEVWMYRNLNLVLLLNYLWEFGKIT